uniref:Uncharacterized protein n=1 Tax=Onchocerca volvulus TaxID=6282 RepID=A0A8R1TWU5_ONCVO
MKSLLNLSIYHDDAIPIIQVYQPSLLADNSNLRSSALIEERLINVTSHLSSLKIISFIMIHRQRHIFLLLLLFLL